ncbi:MAG: DUF937 domain-containing protein [Firmicutes bacterium]|nr:DUF937 domain-containing protein [Bacillota bacterium]
MDVTTLMKLMTSANTVSALSSNAGTQTDQTMQVLSSILPQLLGGASAQATNKNTAESFLKALDDHSKDNTKDIAAFIKNADLEDGEKIVKHLLGQNQKTAVKTAAQTAGVSQADAAKIIANAAPLLMGILGQQNQKQKAATSASQGSALIQALSSSGFTATDAISLLGKFMK